MKPRKYIHVKYCWQAYFKFFRLWPLYRSHASDAFRVPLTFSYQRTITLVGKPARLPRGWNMIFISRHMILSCVITCSDFYPLSNQINLFMVLINI